MYLFRKPPGRSSADWSQKALLLVDLLVIAHVGAQPGKNQSAEPVIDEPAVRILDKIGNVLRVACLLQQQLGGLAVFAEVILGNALEVMVALSNRIAQLFLALTGRRPMFSIRAKAIRSLKVEPATNGPTWFCTLDGEFAISILDWLDSSIATPTRNSAPRSAMMNSSVDDCIRCGTTNRQV